MSSQVIFQIQSGGKPVSIAAGLTWEALTGKDVGKETRRRAKTLKAAKIHAYEGGSNLRGFLLGKGRVKTTRKTYSAAALVANHFSPDSGPVVFIDTVQVGNEQKIVFIGVYKGKPLRGNDEVLEAHDLDRVESLIHDFMSQIQVEGGPILYGSYAGATPLSWEDLLKNPPPAMSDPPAGAEMLLPVLVISLLAGGGYFGWSYYKKEKARKAAIAKKVDPNAFYKQQLQSVVGSIAWAGREDMQLALAAAQKLESNFAGFKIGSSIECDLPAGRCKTSYTRSNGGVYENFAKATGAAGFSKIAYGQDGKSVSVEFLFRPNGTPSASRPPADFQGPSMVREADYSFALWNHAQKLERVGVRMIAPQSFSLVGTIAPGTTETNVDVLVRSYPVTFSAPLYFGVDHIPVLNGLKWDSLVISGLDGKFDVTVKGLIYVRKQNGGNS